jgi:hypothetical protein
MKKKFLIYLLVFLILAMPALSLAQGKIVSQNGGLVPCDNSTAHPCDWTALMSLVNNIINFIIYFMAIPIAAIMFAYAGFLLITAGGEAAGARTKAKSIFTNALIGLVLAVACWLIIKLVLNIVGYSGTWIGF